MSVRFIAIWMEGLILHSVLVLIASACSMPAPATTVPPPAASLTMPPTTDGLVALSSTALPTVTAGAYTTVTPFCPDAPPPRLIVEERGRVLSTDPRPLNIRAGPGTAWRVLKRIDPDQLFFVIDGPKCSDGYLWFKISYQGVEGWIAEGDGSSYYVEPYLPG
jgi:hypothetical protein